MNALGNLLVGFGIRISAAANMASAGESAGNVETSEIILEVPLGAAGIS